MSGIIKHINEHSDDILDENKVSSLLKFSKIINKIYCYKTVPSTQTKAKKSLPGTLIISQKQTCAYGRMQRKWHSQKGGLWFSFVLAPNIASDEITKISLIIALSLNRVFKSLKIKNKIKWTNDILISNKKVVGILAEIVQSKNVVCGIGINVKNNLSQDLKGIATNLQIETKKDFSLEKLLILFFKNFETIYCDFLKNGFGKYKSEYIKNMAYKNILVEVNTGFAKIIGINKGIDGNGCLLIKQSLGLKKVMSGTLRELKNEN